MFRSRATPRRPSTAARDQLLQAAQLSGPRPGNCATRSVTDPRAGCTRRAAAKEWTQPHVKAARDWAKPHFEHGVELAAPRVETAVQNLDPRSTPPATVVDDVLPRITAALAAGSRRQRHRP